MRKRRYVPEGKSFRSRLSSFTHSFSPLCVVLLCATWVQSPLFVLFLDCVWQMMNQYPAAFEFTETYLTVLSDSMWIPLFSTFLFNSPKQRTQHLLVRACRFFFLSCSWKPANTKYEFCYLGFCCRTLPRVKPSLKKKTTLCFSHQFGSGLSSTLPETKHCSTTLCMWAKEPPAARIGRSSLSGAQR